MMYIDHNNLEDSETMMCSWCGKNLHWLNHVGSSVCSHCHDLLINAGVDPVEIFGRDQQRGSITHQQMLAA